MPPATSERLAFAIARAIQRDMLGAGWEAGTFFGAEADLVERYGVSRAVLREAVAILARAGLVSVRRGAGGGLYVGHPAATAMARSIADYLDLIGVTATEIFEARHPLEARSAFLAAANCDDDSAAAFTSAIDIESPLALSHDHGANFHLLVSKQSRNPAIDLFTNALLMAMGDRLVGLDRVPGRYMDESHHDHQEIVDAIVRNDPARAESLMSAHLVETTQWLREIANDSAQSGAPASNPSAQGLPDQVARKIAADIHENGLAPGSVLSSEQAMQERYGVSRSSLREALRSLERYGVVRTRTGPGGGICVGNPDPDAVIVTAVAFLDFLEFGQQSLHEARVAVLLATVELAAQRVDGGATSSMSSLTANARRFLDVGHNPMEVARVFAQDSHIVFGGASRNRPLDLFSRVLIDVTPPPPTPLDRKQQRSNALEVITAYESIIDAVVRGDAAAARRRLAAQLDRSVGRKRPSSLDNGI